MEDHKKPLTRRNVLIAGAGAIGAAALMSGTVPAFAQGIQAASPIISSGGSLPVKQIESIMETNAGTVMDGVLTIDLDRDDLKNATGPGGILWEPGFELTHEFYFQPLGNNKAFLNAEMTMLPHELMPVLDKIFAGGLFFMAEHQHFFDENPQTFHIHFRGIGDPIQLAKAAIAAVKATATPLPQHVPSNPTTPLPTKKLASIIGGTAQVGSGGVVTVSVPRAETIVVAGVALKPETGVSVTVAFEPLDKSGKKAACAPDYALIASEVNPALEVSRAEGFVVHCLYNQETAEHPQLYFSHNLATGDPIMLAHQVSKVLDKMHVKRS